MKTKSFVLTLIVLSMCFYGCGTKGQEDIADMKYAKLEKLPKLRRTDNVCEKMADIGFIKYCLENFDADHDGKLSMFEASAVRKIDCSTAEDFSGIEYFNNLRTFESESVKNADFRYNSFLESLDCDNCDAYIEKIDLRYNPYMKEFHFSGNAKVLLFPEIWKGDFKELRFNSGDLNTIVLPKNTQYIANSAFSCCVNLKEIEIPDSLTIIGDHAFEECSSIVSITFPEGLIEIGSYAFYGCRSLTSITLPESIIGIGTGAFYCCDLKTVHMRIKKPPYLFKISAYDSIGNYFGSDIIPHTIVLYVPKGCAKTYIDAHWDEFFSIIEEIGE